MTTPSYGQPGGTGPYPLPGLPLPPPAGYGNWQLLATTGIGGFALQDATPTILSWTAPSDGNMHRILTLGLLRVTSAETGGEIQSNGTSPDGSAFTGFTNDAGSHGSSGHYTLDIFPVLIAPGTTYYTVQTSALTAGAAVLWAEIWGC